MDKPVIIQKRSLKLEMDPGTYFWCACGKSKDQPFCDGSHKGTKFMPEEVVIEEKQIFPWCMCRYSDKGARCDNKHRELI
ncbi:MAG: CDGSH iron-sulfur domain-containing protein [Lentimicrobiaceae bacterium]|mgnify:FL=1|jgi:CDGSH-type Zn-finger protein|nr:CDGSH iron-sulfur domain-containing protein [Lentimicrobiaceae bacterium]MBT3455381.1 CDGSH iron-sulfur domain-containing protein [Lentimicrobiaceae bacterium]MBT3818779.1 CDGSH iron-sulfur domain-containing protein [Lentimicrobiaceae bacterium]MBT4062046.1 CDGSH iron-sulfur domain-containing protein [Lentimicrobiaceae bacterium]MBT4190822.1 CDGSH iron-sulfur domain-containing protein [Lentimicrobiaceae bacterium]